MLERDDFFLKSNKNKIYLNYVTIISEQEQQDRRHRPEVNSGQCSPDDLCQSGSQHQFGFFGLSPQHSPTMPQKTPESSSTTKIIYQVESKYHQPNTISY